MSPSWSARGGGAGAGLGGDGGDRGWVLLPAPCSERVAVPVLGMGLPGCSGV